MDRYCINIDGRHYEMYENLTVRKDEKYSINRHFIHFYSHNLLFELKKTVNILGFTGHKLSETEKQLRLSLYCKIKSDIRAL